MERWNAGRDGYAFFSMSSAMLAAVIFITGSTSFS
jgi:hypothetical protein